MTKLPTFPNHINGKEHWAETPGEPMLSTHGFRHDWEKGEVVRLLSQPLLDLVDQAREVHRHHHADGNVQLASLLSIKTGACPEDCKYCPQSAHYAKSTGLKREEVLDVDEVLSDRDKKNLHSSLTLFAEATNEPLMRQMLSIWFGCRADEVTKVQLDLRP